MKIRLALVLTVFMIAVSVCVTASAALASDAQDGQNSGENHIFAEDDAEYIKWVDFKVSVHAMSRALDICRTAPDMRGRYADVLAYVTLKNGNRFVRPSDAKVFGYLESELKAGRDPFAVYEGNEYYRRYRDSYRAAMNGIVGSYTDAAGEEKWGVRGYNPIAAGYYYNDYDDFGTSRSFGYKRRHLGHDMMGSVGTPIAAVEGGVVKELGWNRYGGWRVGIRSFDGKRYYYYAHLRKGRPFAAGLELGGHVRPGEIIGYLGKTGYSNTPDKNMDTGSPHLHFGLQLIFDESQVEGRGEIWIDVYALCDFLAQNRRAKTVKTPEGESVSQNLIRVMY